MIRSLKKTNRFNTERFRSGDVCERCLWQLKRAIRSGSGRNFVSEANKKFRLPQQVITGLTRKRHDLVTKVSPQSLETLHFFGILSAKFSEVGRQFSIKIPNQKFNTERYRSGHNGADSKSVCAQAHEGSNPSLSAKKQESILI